MQVQSSERKFESHEIMRDSLLILAYLGYVFIVLVSIDPTLELVFGELTTRSTCFYFFALTVFLCQPVMRFTDAICKKNNHDTLLILSHCLQNKLQLQTSRKLACIVPKQAINE